MCLRELKTVKRTKSRCWGWLLTGSLLLILIHKKQMLGVVINWKPTFDTFSQKADVGGGY